MNNGVGRFYLSCALYTKWAILLNETDKQNEAQEYFEQAKNLNSNYEKIIKETSKYKSTRITADALRDWLETKGSEISYTNQI